MNVDNQAIFVLLQGKPYGPYTPDAVKTYLTQGLIIASDPARTAEMTTYVTVAQLLQPTVRTETSGAEVPLGGAVRSHTEGNALTWPFHQYHWWEGLWMPFLWWIPFFGPIVSFGWFVRVIRKRATSSYDELPRAQEFPQIAKDGLIVGVMAILYFLVPIFLILFFCEYEVLAKGLVLLKGGWIGIIFSPYRTIRAMAEQGAFQYILDIGVVPTICAIIAWPLFILGELRYSITGKIRSFFNLFGNIGLGFRYFGDLFVYALSVFMIRIALYLLPAIFATLLGSTVFLAPVAIVLLVVPVAIAHWVVAHLAGTLGRVVCDGRHLVPKRQSYPANQITMPSLTEHAWDVIDSCNPPVLVNATQVQSNNHVLFARSSS